MAELYVSPNSDFITQQLRALEELQGSRRLPTASLVPESSSPEEAVTAECTAVSSSVPVAARQFAPIEAEVVRTDESQQHRQQRRRSSYSRPPPVATSLEAQELEEAAAAASEQDVEEVLLLTGPPSDERYKRSDSARLLLAQKRGRMAAAEEQNTVARQDRTIRAYNNQIEMDLDRANQIAVMENMRELRLENPKIVETVVGYPPRSPARRAPPAYNSSAAAITSAARTTTPPQAGAASYFQSHSGGYEVKEYDVDDYDCSFSYSMAEYKSDYD